MTTNTDKKYTILVDYDGDLKGGTEAREYNDGSIRNERGLLLTKPPWGNEITKENAREMQLARATKAREAFQRGLARGVLPKEMLKDESLDNYSINAWEEIAKHTGEVFMKTDNVRGIGEVLSKLAKLGNFDVNVNNEREHIEQSVLSMLGEDLVKHILKQARERGDP